ncbi:uncharacterized protein [Amphiura filiformis]|uniref:uncharacterized protein n=1 Tax=Amphiura filiformis TaxID=82378 RepID=UPI003B20DDCD
MKEPRTLKQITWSCSSWTISRRRSSKSMKRQTEVDVVREAVLQRIMFFVILVNRIEQFHNQVMDLQTQSDANLDDVIKSIEKIREEAKGRVSSQTNNFIQHLRETETMRCNQIDTKAAEEKRRIQARKSQVNVAIKALANTCKANQEKFLQSQQLATDEWVAFQQEFEQLSQTLIDIAKKHRSISFTTMEFLTKTAPDEIFVLDKMGILHEIESTWPIMKLRDGVIHLPRGRRVNVLTAEEPRSSSAPPIERRRRQGIRRPSQEPGRPSQDLFRPSRDSSRPSHDPRRPSHDPRRPSQDPRRPSHDPRRPSQDPRRPSQDPRRPSHDPRRPSQDPRRPSHDPRRPSQDPRRPSQDPRHPSQEPRRPSHDPRRETVIVGVLVGGQHLNSTPISEEDENDT